MRILMWDVHGGYTDSLLAGAHDYLFLPRDESGRGGLARYGGSPPSNAYEVTAEELRDHRHLPVIALLLIGREPADEPLERRE